MKFYQEKQNKLKNREEGAIQICIEHALNDDESGGRLIQLNKTHSVCLSEQVVYFWHFVVLGYI